MSPRAMEDIPVPAEILLRHFPESTVFRVFRTLGMDYPTEIWRNDENDVCE